MADAVERIIEPYVDENLKRRKTALFPDDHRYIVDTSLEPLKSGGWHLNVTSISPEELEHETPASEHADSAGADGRENERADAASPKAPAGAPFPESRTENPD